MNISEAITAWREHDAWRALKPRSVRGYESRITLIEAWAGERDIQAITAKDVRQFLSRWQDAQTQRQYIKTTLSMIFKIAIEEGAAERNPCDLIVGRRTQTKRAVTLWTPLDVEAYAKAAARIGWRSGEVVYPLMWQTGADISDVMSWREQSLCDGAIDFDRGKTGEPTRIPISPDLSKKVQAFGAPLVRDLRGKALCDAGSDRIVWGLHRRAQRHAMAAGAPKLGLKHLRHSAATHAKDCGADQTSISRLLAHANERMSREIYTKATECQLVALQRARGII